MLTLHEKNRIFQHQYQRYLYLFHDWFPLEFVFVYNISLMYKFLLELIKSNSKVQEKNMTCERALNFDQWWTFSENCKTIRVWLWLVYKFTENNCRLRLFSGFIQTQKRYLIALLLKFKWFFYQLLINRSFKYDRTTKTMFTN